MKLTVPLKLRPTDAQRVALRQTLERANFAANTISSVAWPECTFGQLKLQRLVYADTRMHSGLNAQLVVRLIAKLADADKLDHPHQRRFGALGSVTPMGLRNRHLAGTIFLTITSAFHSRHAV